MGFRPSGTGNQAGLGCRERGLGWWKLSPFSFPFKPSLKSKPAGLCVCGAGAGAVPRQPGWSGKPSICPPPALCGLPAPAQLGQKIQRQRRKQTSEVL